MLRIGLFLLTNLAVVLVVGIILSVLGVGKTHTADGLNYTNLLIMCFAYGMVGSAISLFLSKPIAKWTTGTQIIEQPSNPAEAKHG